MPKSITRFILSLITVVALMNSLKSQNVGIGEENPGSKLSVHGGLAIGNNYSVQQAPANGAIIQGALGLGTLHPDTNAILDMSQSAKGVLFPRVTHAQRMAFSNTVPDGMVLYDTDSNEIFYHDAGTWYSLIAVDQNNNIIGAGHLPLGTAGTTGAMGATGPIGPTGTIGVTGAAGASGLQGIAGITGATGATGAAGPAGINGVAGATGATGATGNGFTGTIVTGQVLFGGTLNSLAQSTNLFWDNTNGRLGLGTAMPQYLLDVRGQTQITGTLKIGAYTLPATDGNATQVLATNGSGTVAWQNVSSLATGWALTGNSSTTPGTNFIGTIDNQSLVFKANNQQAGKIDLPLNNTIWGYQSGNSMSTGSNNSFNGYQAGYSNTSGNTNTAMGSTALFANTTGSNNLAMGMGAMASNTTGSGNTAVGSGALKYGGTATGNVAVGVSSLSNATGNANTAVGAYTMQVNTSGANNTANGYAALGANTSGSGNTANGAGSLQTNTTGINNTAIGNGAMQSGTGNNNVGLGAFALQNEGTGASNVAVGYTGLANVSTGNGNSCLGNSSGVTITTGSNNVFIGNNADATSAALNNAIAIGYNAKVGASNNMILGGTGSYAVNVGIGTTTPLSVLDINGGVAIGTYAGLNAAPANGLIVSGNVGFGTGAPGNKLEVNSGTGGASGLRLKQLPAGAVLFMSAVADVAQNNQNFYFDATNYRLGITTGTTPNSTVQIGGSLSTAIVTKTASYTAGASDYTILCNNTMGAINITLPLAAGSTGRVYAVKKISVAGNNVIVKTNGSSSELIDGVSTLTINGQYNSVLVQSDGSNWYVIGNY